MLHERKVRKAVRAVIFDEVEEKIAVLEVKNGDYHKIPGGEVENDETNEETAIREALEEGACDVQLITKIGEFEFVEPTFPNLVNHSVCFLAKKIKDHKTTYFTEEEKNDSFKLLWLNIDEAIKLFEDVKSKIPFELIMNNRDLKFIKIAKNYLPNKN